MKIKTNLVVVASILFLVMGAMVGCGDQQDQAGTTSTEYGDQAGTQTETEDQTGTTGTGDQATAPDQTQTPGMAQEDTGSEMAQGQTGQAQDVSNFMGKDVNGTDGEKLGTVARADASGITSGYVLIKAEEGDQMHAVPADLLKEDAQGQLTASLDKNTFSQSPTFTEDEWQQLSESQLEEVRGYYENKTQQSGSM